MAGEMSVPVYYTKSLGYSSIFKWKHMHDSGHWRKVGIALKEKLSKGDIHGGKIDNTVFALLLLNWQ